MPYAVPPEPRRGLRDDESLTKLVGRLAHESGDLLRIEIARARAEMVERASEGVAAGISLGVLGSMVVIGLAAATVGGILGLGALLGSYTAGAFIVAAIAFALGGIGYAALRRPIRRAVRKRVGRVPAPEVPALPPGAERHLPAARPPAEATH